MITFFYSLFASFSFQLLLAKGWFLSLQIGCCSVNFQVYEIIKSVFSIDNSEVIKGTVPTSGVHYLWQGSLAVDDDDQEDVEQPQDGVDVDDDEYHEQFEIKVINASVPQTVQTRVKVEGAVQLQDEDVGGHDEEVDD